MESQSLIAQVESLHEFNVYTNLMAGSAGLISQHLSNGNHVAVAGEGILIYPRFPVRMLIL